MQLWRWFQPISFQIIWLACVLGGNQWLFIAAILLLIHFVLTPSLSSDLKTIPLVILGYAIDMLFTQVGLFVFNAWPLWLLVLWVAFVLNFGHSLSFLRHLKFLWLVTIGAVGGSYAYWISWQLGAVAWPFDPLLTTSIIAATWALLLPLLVKGDLFFRRLGHG
ncbi:MAG: DUF2878 domain-containing protein [Gammaproteobacteria bacterium]|jgi:hypothetical protein|nr:DUF2878 domain-containing protein [Gammaproteobacteria bacterium]